MRPLPPAPAAYNQDDQQAVREAVRQYTDQIKQPTSRYIVPDAAAIPKSTVVTAADTLADTQKVLAQLLRDLKAKGVIS
jgi:homoserine trans-succinylase